MREAAADLEFEEAARLRDELKRLTATELAIADDPFARQSAVDRAVDDAFLTAVRDGAEDKAAPQRQSLRRQARANGCSARAGRACRRRLGVGVGEEI